MKKPQDAQYQVIFLVYTLSTPITLNIQKIVSLLEDFINFNAITVGM